MSSMSLKGKLSIAASAAILVVGTVLTINTYFTAKNNLEDYLTDQTINIGETFASSVNYWFKSKEFSLKSFSSNTNIGLSDVDRLKQVRVSGDFDNVFYARTDGSQLNANGVVLPPGNDDPRKWDWYQKAQATPGVSYISPPSIAAATGQYVLSIGRAVTNEDQVVAILGVDVTVTELLNQLNKIKLPFEGHAFLINNNGIILAHTEKDKLSKPISSLYPDLSYEKLTQVKEGDFILAKHNNVTERVYITPIPDQSQMLVMVMDDEKIAAPLHEQLFTSLGLLFVVLFFSLGAFAIMCTALFRSLGVVSQALAKIADGTGDLTQRIHLNNQDEVGILASNFNKFVGSLHQLITHVRGQAKRIGDDSAIGMDRTKTSVSELGRQQQEIAMIATALTEMSSSTQEIANNAEQTAAAALQSANRSKEGKDLVNKSRESIKMLSNGIQEATDVIGQLDKHAHDINSILSAIQSIAGQTNLLALNAAIEAARAGQHGRGFAVVADEVRVLSQRTAASTTEIQSTIETLQRTTQKAVAMMGKSTDMANSSVKDALDASDALEEITIAVSSISDMASQIATAAEEQSHVTSEISSNIIAIKDVADEVAGDAILSEQDAIKLQGQVQELNNKVSHFIL